MAAGAAPWPLVVAGSSLSSSGPGQSSSDSMPGICGSDSTELSEGTLNVTGGDSSAPSAAPFAAADGAAAAAAGVPGAGAGGIGCWRCPKDALWPNADDAS